METIRVRFLAEFLNEMLACERAAADCYRTVLARCADGALRTRLQAHESECRHHERVLTDLVFELAGEPGRAPATVRPQLAALRESLGQPVEPDLREFFDLQTLLDCETLCQRNWALLREVAECNGDPAIQKAVGRVGNDENRHVQALRDELFSRAPTVMLSR